MRSMQRDSEHVADHAEDAEPDEEQARSAPALAPSTWRKYGAKYENSVNWPAPDSAVTSDDRHQHRVARTPSRQARSDSAAGRTPSGIAAHTQAAASGRQHGDQRERPAPAEGLADAGGIGMPSTEASDQPRKMKVIARPRCSGGVIDADRGAGLRREHGGAEHGDARAPAAARRSSASARRARGRPRTRASDSGEQPAAVEARRPSRRAAARRSTSTAAPTAISWPASATETCSDCDQVVQRAGARPSRRSR